jgi:hypothetical protein
VQKCCYRKLQLRLKESLLPHYMCDQICMVTASQMRESMFDSWSRQVDSAFHPSGVSKMRFESFSKGQSVRVEGNCVIP